MHLAVFISYFEIYDELEAVIKQNEISLLILCLLYQETIHSQSSHLGNKEENHLLRDWAS